MTARFHSSSENLRITVSDDRAEDWALAAIGLLVERIPGKVYFLGREGIYYPRLREAHEGHSRVTILDPGNKPRNFLQSARVVHGDGAIWVVSSKEDRLSAVEWSEFAERLKAMVRCG